MKSDIQKVSACRVKMAVEATAEEIDPIFKQVRETVKKQANIPGFRKGKAPWAIIEKQYGDKVKNDTAKSVIRTLMSAAQEAKLKVANVIEVQDYKADMGAGASATFELDLMPEFELPDVSSWQTTKINTTITDEEVEKQLNEVRNMMSSFREATEEDVATEDDLLSIDFTSDLNGDDFSDAAKHYIADNDYWTQIREDAFLPGLKNALTGKKVGETVQFAGTFAEDYAIAELAGKTVNYTVTLKTLRKRQAATDEEMLSRYNHSSIDEFKDLIKGHLERSSKIQEDNRVKADIRKAIIEWAKFDMPASVIDSRIYDILANDKSNPLETFKNDIEGLKNSDVYKNAKKQAEEMMAVIYTLEALADKREVKLSSDEYKAAIANLAANVNMPEDKLVNRLIENGRMDEFLTHERVEKMLTLLVEECAVL